MQIFFKTREQARQAKFGKFYDNGKDSVQGKRYARDLSGNVGKNKAGADAK